MKIREIIVESEELNEGVLRSLSAAVAMSLAAAGVSAQGLENTQQGQLAWCAGINFAKAEAHRYTRIMPGHGHMSEEYANGLLQTAIKGGLPKNVALEIAAAGKNTGIQQVEKGLSHFPNPRTENDLNRVLGKVSDIVRSCAYLQSEIEDNGWKQKIGSQAQRPQAQSQQSGQSSGQLIGKTKSTLGTVYNVYSNENGFVLVTDDGSIKIYLGKDGDAFNPGDKRAFGSDPNAGKGTWKQTRSGVKVGADGDKMLQYEFPGLKLK
jgi:hypothetical protein